jgi:hypothetical protein
MQLAVYESTVAEQHGRRRDTSMSDAGLHEDTCSYLCLVLQVLHVHTAAAGCLQPATGCGCGQPAPRSVRGCEQGSGSRVGPCDAAQILF